MRSRCTGSQRVAVADFDVHHGNGTEDIFANDPRVLMVSTFQHPFYPYSGTEDPAPNMLNVPVCRPAPAAMVSVRR
jgi:acetoin utilization deacetylase AcuC-like enzyme